jgi:hypothetical protein
VTLGGYINEFFETGCEGVMWYFFEDGKEWPECIHEPGDGDHLKVFGENGEVLFDSIIERDRKTGWQSYNNTNFPEHGQQVALGCWVHWIQRGFEPDDWAKLFFYQYLKGNEGKKPLRAELTKKQI